MSRKLSEATISAIVDGARRGESIRALAKRLHVDRESVAVALRRAGVAYRRPRQSGAFNPSSQVPDATPVLNPARDESAKAIPASQALATAEDLEGSDDFSFRF